MKYFLSILGVLAAAVLLFVSAAMNWRFGFSLGKTELDSQIYGAASAAADGMKALLPFFILWALRQKSYGQMLAGSLLWTVCAAYSLTSSLGFAALNRAEVVGTRTVQATIYQDLRGELKREQAKLDWVPQHRSIGEVEADLTAVLIKPVVIRKRTKGTLSQVTKNCAAPDWRTQKRCDKVLNLRKDLAVSRQAKKLEDRITDLKNKVAVFSATASSGAVSGKSDPQADLLSKLSGFNTDDVQIALVILVAMLVELGSGLGLFVAFAHMTIPGSRAAEIIEPKSLKVVNPRPKRHLLGSKSNIERYFRSNVVWLEGASVTETDMHNDYRNWCEKTGREALSRFAFGNEVKKLGVTKSRLQNRTRHIGVELKALINAARNESQIEGGVVAQLFNDGRDKPVAIEQIASQPETNSEDSNNDLEGVNKSENVREGSQDAKHAVG